VPRFEQYDEVVLDRLTGLIWTRNANPAEFPLRWQEALHYISDMNREKAFGYSDWRLPNRRELRSLVSHQAKKPVLPENHPFTNIFLGWYWTSTTSMINPAYAWSIHMEGAPHVLRKQRAVLSALACQGRRERHTACHWTDAVL
jgi:hypothetical protein